MATGSAPGGSGGSGASDARPPPDSESPPRCRSCRRPGCGDASWQPSTVTLPCPTGGQLLQVIPGGVGHRGVHVLGQVPQHVGGDVLAGGDRGPDPPGRVSGQQQPAPLTERGPRPGCGEARPPAGPAESGLV